MNIERDTNDIYDSYLAFFEDAFEELYETDSSHKLKNEPSLEEFLLDQGYNVPIVQLQCA